MKCSLIGPRASAGRYCSSVTIATTASRNPMNRGPSVGMVPAGGFAFFLSANDPAIATIGIAWATRPTNIATPVLMLYQSVFPLRPAQDEPLSAHLEA